MAEDEKMFHIGVWALCGVIVLTVGLQVCYRTQIRTLNHVRREIVRTQQDIAAAETKFEGYKTNSFFLFFDSSRYICFFVFC